MMIMASCKVTEPTAFSIHHHHHHHHHPHHHSPRLHSHRSGKLQSIHSEDILSPLPNCKSVNSPCSSPRVPLRQRSYTIDNSFSRPRTSLPKDPIQPKHGSISDIHIQAIETNTDDEEDELFVDLPPLRSRSFTCPDNIVNRRKLKVRSLRRPSTPPPEDLCSSLKHMSIPADVEKQIDILVKLNST